MPAYISHAIMGEQLYDESINQESLFKIPISKDELRGYSIGPDLALTSKKLAYDPQNYHTQEFFLSMIDYIKENKLIENSHILALLYGYIGHYFLDINTHPLIYYIDCGCQKVGMISNHNLIEGYLSSYLAEKVLGKNIMDIKPSYFDQINLKDEEVSKLLNSIYGSIYGDYQIVKTYKKVMDIFSMLESVIKSGLISKEILILISRFNKFLQVNNLTLPEITNEINAIYRNPVTGKEHNDSFIELYDKSIQMSQEAIEEVNKYLYSGSPNTQLSTIFSDLSYDTGVLCSLGKNMSYVRKRNYLK